MTGATRLEFNWADPCRRVMMSFLDNGRKGLPSKIYTPDPGFPWLVLVRPASLEAQQLRGLDQTSWLELLPDRVVSGLECGIRAVWQGGFLLSVRGGCEGVPGQQRLHQRPLLGGVSNPQFGSE